MKMYVLFFLQIMFTYQAISVFETTSIEKQTPTQSTFATLQQKAQEMFNSVVGKKEEQTISAKQDLNSIKSLPKTQVTVRGNTYDVLQDAGTGLHFYKNENNQPILINDQQQQLFKNMYATGSTKTSLSQPEQISLYQQNLSFIPRTISQIGSYFNIPHQNILFTLPPQTKPDQQIEQPINQQATISTAQNKNIIQEKPLQSPSQQMITQQTKEDLLPTPIQNIQVTTSSNVTDNIQSAKTESSTSTKKRVIFSPVSNYIELDIQAPTNDQSQTTHQAQLTKTGPNEYNPTQENVIDNSHVLDEQYVIPTKEDIQQLIKNANLTKLGLMPANHKL